MFSGVKLGFVRCLLLSSAVFLPSEECLADAHQKMSSKKYRSVVSDKKKIFLRNRATLDKSMLGFVISFGLVQAKSKVIFADAAETASVLADVRAKDNWEENKYPDKQKISIPYTEFFIDSDCWKNFLRIDMTAAKCKHIYGSSKELRDKTVNDMFYCQSCEVKIEPYDFLASFNAGEDVVYDKKSEIHCYLRNPNAEYRKKANAIFRRNFYNFQDWINAWNSAGGKQKILQQEEPFLLEREMFLYLMPLVKKNGLMRLGFSQKLNKCGGSLALNYRMEFKKLPFLFGCGIDLCFVPKTVRLQDNTDYTDLKTTKILRFYDIVKLGEENIKKLSDLKDIKNFDVVVFDPNGGNGLIGLSYPKTFGLSNFGRLFFSRAQDGSITFSSDNFYFLNCLAFAEFYSKKVYDIIKSKEPMVNENGRFLEPGRDSNYYADFMNKLAINEDNKKLMYYDFQTKRNSIIPSFDISFGKRFLNDKLLFEIFLGISYVQARTFFKAKTLLTRYGFPEKPYILMENVRKMTPSFGVNICYRLSERVNCFSKLRYIGVAKGTKTKLGRTMIWTVGLGFRF